LLSKVLRVQGDLDELAAALVQRSRDTQLVTLAAGERFVITKPTQNQ
jgi:hypothetical protein